MRVYVLNGGSIDVSTPAPPSQCPESPRGRSHANPVYLVEHRDGRLLWGTGLPDRLAALPDGSRPRELVTHRVRLTLHGQLGLLGAGPDDIDFLALPALSAEYAGNADAFESSVLLAQRDAFYDAFPAVPAVGQDRSLTPEYKSLADQPRILLDGDHDVFGDGRVVVKRLPGTFGHQGLFLDLPQSGGVLILAGVEFGGEQAVPPGTSGLSCASVGQVWLQHDADRFASSRRPPQFYG